MNLTTHPAACKRGWPWNEMDEANRRHEEAKRREWEARVNNRPDDVEEAASEQSEALADRQTLRDRLTDLVIGGLRIALEERPEQVSAQLASVPVVAELVKDVAAIADAVATLEAKAAGGRR